MPKIITFESGLDSRTRQATRPQAARFHIGNGVYRFIVIGTDYGHLHTAAGDVRTWATYSGAARAARKYTPL